MQNFECNLTEQLTLGNHSATISRNRDNFYFWVGEMKAHLFSRRAASRIIA